MPQLGLAPLALALALVLVLVQPAAGWVTVSPQVRLPSSARQMAARWLPSIFHPTARLELVLALVLVLVLTQ